MMKVTQLLTNEHLLILTVLNLLLQSREKLENGRSVPAVFFDLAMIFCSGFADQFHHFKEEFLLFGLLSYKKQGRLDSAMGTLRYQHECCKKCVNGIKQALKGYKEGDEMATTFLLESLAVYVSLLRRHIFQEDMIFFPMAEKILSLEEKKTLHDQFKKEEQRIRGTVPVYEKYEKIADELNQIMIPR